MDSKTRMWEVQRGFRKYEVEATTRNKAKYAAYKQYKKSHLRSRIDFHDFFIRISSAKRKYNSERS